MASTVHMTSDKPVYISSEVSLFLKYSLFALNVLFWSVGLFMVIIGIYAQRQKTFDSIEKTLPWFLDPVNILIFIGIVIFLLAFLGWFGALRENIIILRIFEYTIDIILIAEVAICIYIAIDRRRVKEAIGGVLKKMIPKYRDDEDLQSLIDWVQQNMKCCGARNEEDWDQNIYFNCSTKFSPEKCGVPFSCCINYKKEFNRQCGYNVRSKEHLDTKASKIYLRGCVDGITNLFTDNLLLFIFLAIAVILLQLITTQLAHFLVNGIVRQKMKWE